MTAPPVSPRSTNAIEVHGLRRSFGPTPVLRELDLSVQRGSVFALLGPNGAGKTTLVRILATLLAPDAGRATVLGHDVVDDRRQVRRSIGLTGQHASVDELLTGRENLVTLARLLRFSGAAARARADELLDRFDLAEAAARRVATYSGGMRRRLDLAASLLTDPPVVFLDEPTTGLDPRSRRTLWDTIADLRRNGTTILLTTQYLEEADQLADRIAVLDGGRLLVEGTAAELKRLVGRETLTVTVAPSAFDTAMALVGAEGAVGTVTGDPATSSLTLPLDGPDQLRSTLQRLADGGVTVTGVRVSAPTLDDVFLHLTDRATEEVGA